MKISSQAFETETAETEGDGTSAPLKTKADGKTAVGEIGQFFLQNNKVSIRPVMAEFYLKVRQASMMNVPVLLVGESGAGKNHTAKLIHQKSSRNPSGYYEININEINENLIESTLFGSVRGAFTGSEDRKGLFESAENGTLFLDEIGDFPRDLQTKLFGFLDNGTFRKIGSTKTLTSSARLMFATNSNLFELVERGKFRRELFYRISIFIIIIPSLREHAADIPYLAEEFAKKSGKTLSPDAVKKLCAYDWPGNVRELKNCILRSCIYSNGEEITEENIVFDHEIFGRFSSQI